MLAANTHEVPQIATIAVSLGFAFAGGLLAVRLRLPPLVGYLLAGIVVAGAALAFAGRDGKS